MDEKTERMVFIEVDLVELFEGPNNSKSILFRCYNNFLDIRDGFQKRKLFSTITMAILFFFLYQQVVYATGLQSILFPRKATVDHEVVESNFINGHLFTSREGGKSDFSFTLDVTFDSTLMVGMLTPSMPELDGRVIMKLIDPYGTEYGMNEQGEIVNEGLSVLEPGGSLIIPQTFLISNPHGGLISAVIENPKPGQWTVQAHSSGYSDGFVISGSVLTDYSEGKIKSESLFVDYPEGEMKLEILQSEIQESLYITSASSFVDCNSCEIGVTAAIMIGIVAVVVAVMIFAEIPAMFATAVAYVAAFISNVLITFGVPVGVALGIGQYAVDGPEMLLDQIFNGVVTIADGAYQMALSVSSATCTWLGPCADVENPSCTMYWPEGGEVLSGVFPVIALASDNREVDFVQFEYSRDFSSWYMLSRDYDGSDGWSVQFDSESLGISYDTSVWARAWGQDTSGNYSSYDGSGSFAIDNRVIVPSSISVQAAVSPPTAELQQSVTVSGTAQYNTGGAVVNGTVTIVTSENTWTTYLDSSGSFSRDITAPSSSQNIQVSVSDGNLMGTDSAYISISSPPPQSDYTVDNLLSCVDSDTFNYNCVTSSQHISSRHEYVDVWLYLIDIYEQLDVRFTWYKPDGSFYGFWSDTVPDPGAGFYWEWYNLYSRFYVNGYDISDMEGVWTVKVEIDDGGGYDFVGSVNFTVRYAMTEHLMAEDMQLSSPWLPINPKNIFTQSDQRATTWANLEDVSDGFNFEWKFYDPRGNLYFTETNFVSDPGFGNYWDWYRIGGWIDINGYQAEMMTGAWRVDVFAENPWGSMEKIYTEHFEIKEDPQLDPQVSVSIQPGAPAEADNISFSISASDNAYLQKVTLHWNDGNAYSRTWDNLSTNSSTWTHQIGSLLENTSLTFYAEAVDWSGNKTISSATTVVIQDTDVSPPSITNVNITELGDSDGVYEEGEGVRLSWNLQDQSGISSIRFEWDGIEQTVEGSYYVDMNSLTVGDHNFKIYALDGDTSPMLGMYEGIMTVVYPCIDNDSDGYGQNCLNGPDCDDNLVTGQGCHNTCSIFYQDGDTDGYGNASVSSNRCVAPSGYVSNNTDCSDTNTNTWNTCATCNDDDADNWFEVCNQYLGINGPDCKDGNDDVYPGALELCDLIDNQCAGDPGFGQIDEGCDTVSPTSFSFSAACGGSNPATQTLLIQNAIGVSWTLNDNASWLTLSTTSGTGNGGCAVYANVSGLTCGQTYNAMITVSATGGTITPSSIPVMLEVAVFGDPAIVLSSNTIDFGIISVGEHAEHQLTISNIGDADLVIGATINGLNYNIDCPADSMTVIPKGAVTCTVNFLPDLEAFYTGQVTIMSNDPDTPMLIASIEGAGINESVATIDLSPSLVEFGSITLGQIVSRTITISNVGDADLAAQASITGTDYQFSCPLNPMTIIPHGSIQCTIKYAPSSVAFNSGVLTIDSNDPSRPTTTLSLSGNGVSLSVPAIRVSKSTINFGYVTLGQTSLKMFEIFNEGDGPLDTTLNVFGTDFYLDCPVNPVSILPDGSLQCFADFSPQADGFRTGVVTIYSNDPDMLDRYLTLSGIGTSLNIPDIQVTNERLDFGSIALGESFTRTLTVFNIGTANLGVEISISGDDFNMVCDSNPAMVIAGDSFDCEVTFSPGDVSYNMGVITITSNDSDELIYYIPLSGNGMSSNPPPPSPPPPIPPSVRGDKGGGGGCQVVPGPLTWTEAANAGFNFLVWLILFFLFAGYRANLRKYKRMRKGRRR